MEVLQISKHGLPAEVMELVDIPKPDAPEAVGPSVDESTSTYGER